MLEIVLSFFLLLNVRILTNVSWGFDDTVKEKEINVFAYRKKLFKNNCNISTELKMRSI